MGPSLFCVLWGSIMGVWIGLKRRMFWILSQWFFSEKIILCQNFKAQQLEISVSFPFWFHFLKKKIKLNKIWTFLFKKAKLWAIVYQEMDRFFSYYISLAKKNFAIRKNLQFSIDIISSVISVKEHWETLW